MCQTKEEVAGGLVMDLNLEGTVSETTDIDDRRNVFSIVQPVNKKLVSMLLYHKHCLKENVNYT